MNNKLIAEIERHRERQYVLSKVIPEIKTLLKRSSTFTKEESIIALEKIKQHLILLENELKNGYVTAKKMRRDLHNSCTHEVLIKNSNCYECCICGKYFIFDDIDFDTFLIDSLEVDPMNYHNLIFHIINEIATSDEDIMDVFEDRLYSKNDNLLVYRRSRWKRERLLT